MLLKTIFAMSKEFFQNLEEFLPVFVPAMPSYLHAGLVFIAVVLIGHIITERSTTIFDIDGDGTESATELKMRKFIFRGTSVFFGLFLADVAFAISWRLRNKINRKHLVYSRWFPGIFQNGSS